MLAGIGSFSECQEQDMGQHRRWTKTFTTYQHLFYFNDIDKIIAREDNFD